MGEDDGREEMKRRIKKEGDEMERDESGGER